VYSATLSLTSALDGVAGKLNAQAALPPGETMYPLYRSSQGLSKRMRKISPSLGLDPRTVRPLASRYTD